MKKYGFVVALLLTSSAFASKTSDIEGTYECTGNEVGTHAAFKCQMTIKKTGETYASTADCSDNNSYRGTSIYDKHTHLLSTGFINPKKAEEAGVCVAKIKRDGSLVSKWTYLDKTTIAQSKCFKQQK